MKGRTYDNHNDATNDAKDKARQSSTNNELQKVYGLSGRPISCSENRTSFFGMVSLRAYC